MLERPPPPEGGLGSATGSCREATRDRPVLGSLTFGRTASSFLGEGVRPRDLLRLSLGDFSPPVGGEDVGRSAGGGAAAAAAAAAEAGTWVETGDGAVAEDEVGTWVETEAAVGAAAAATGDSGAEISSTSRAAASFADPDRGFINDNAGDTLVSGCGTVSPLEEASEL